jgi:hypothetical protein
MAGVLSFSEWIGGPDTNIIESVFPSTTKTYAYNFGRNITGWEFKLDAQVIVVDTISYTRDGEPNFDNSTVLGSFPYAVIESTTQAVNTGTFIRIVDANNGIVNVTHPAGFYTGSILPDARSNNPLQVMGFTWTDNSTPKQINTHRLVKILAWEPQVGVGNPTTSTNYTAITTV